MDLDWVNRRQTRVRDNKRRAVHSTYTKRDASGKPDTGSRRTYAFICSKVLPLVSFTMAWTMKIEINANAA